MNGRQRGAWLWLLALCVAPMFPLQAAPPAISFVEVTYQAGIDFSHGFVGNVGDEWPGEQFEQRISGGVAAGDYDRDGWVDLYAVRGDIGLNLLYRNLGDGTFDEVGGVAGVGVMTPNGTGPHFADVDGDGWLDLLINSISSDDDRLFRNLGDGSFDDVTPGCGLSMARTSFGAAFGDPDGDGDLDLAQSRWEHFAYGCTPPCTGHLWENDGGGVFTDADPAWQIGYVDQDHSFTPNFADIDNDGLADLLVAADYGQSRVFLNQGDGTFADVTDPAVITDQHGMGAAVGDYDNDGDLDWFVTSIHDLFFGGIKNGNRLYRNQGDGSFEDVTDAAGVRHGHWGWGACFADFDNDGHLDIFHVNGWWTDAQHGETFWVDPSRLFMSQGDGTFAEHAADVGLVDTGQGRGVVCFDYDRDGDIDLYVANNNQPPSLYRNDGGNARSFLNLRLRRLVAGELAIGARVYATVGAVTQMREIRSGSNYVSQNPQEVHFGLDGAASVDLLAIHWPDGTVDVWADVPANRFLGAAAGRLCALDLVLGGHSVAAAESHAACDRLTAAAGLEVLGGGELALAAGRSVRLGDGFAVLAGGRLSVQIDPLLTEIRP